MRTGANGSAVLHEEILNGPARIINKRNMEDAEMEEWIEKLIHHRGTESAKEDQKNPIAFHPIPKLCVLRVSEAQSTLRDLLPL